MKVDLNPKPSPKSRGCNGKALRQSLREIRDEVDTVSERRGNAIGKLRRKSHSGVEGHLG